MAALLAATSLTSCLGDDDNTYDYAAWKSQNEEYVVRMTDTVSNGKKVFQKIIPVWAPDEFILAQWHNDTSLTEGNLKPMDNSTVEVVYKGSYVNGVVFDSSYSKPDSVATFKPCETVVGFWTMLTNMHVGDSVTCVIPTSAGYGASSSNIMPYSTLIFNIKMKGIKAYEIPNN